LEGKTILPLIVFSVLLLVPAGAQDAFALPVTVVFENTSPIIRGPSIVESGITITGSNDVVAGSPGLGVEGGISDITVDGFSGIESITFTFDTVFVNVRYDVVNSCGGTNGETTAEAFDSNGDSLGTVQISESGIKDVSNLFGNVPISKFTLTANPDICVTIKSITYDLDGDGDILTEIQNIEEKLDGDRPSLITQIVDTLTSIVTDIGTILGILEDENSGLGAIKSDTEMIKDDIAMLKSQVTSIEEKLDSLLEAPPSEDTFTEKECGKFQKDADKAIKKGNEVPPEIIANLEICAELYP